MDYDDGDMDDYNNSDYSDEENPKSDNSYISSHHSESGQNQSNSDDNGLKSDEEDSDEMAEDSEFDHRVQIIDNEAENDKPNEEKITTPFITKYEKARVLGVRAVQISKNAPIYYNMGDSSNSGPLEIAERELKEGKIPFIIRRYLPDGTYEHWKLSELKSLD